MSNASLRDILDLLPESCQERAILDCLQRMFSNGEWEQVDAFLPPICGLNGHSSFKARAIGIGAKCAVRTRNFSLAVKRLDIISKLGAGEDTLNSIADALFLLAIQLLPENPSPIARLWHPLLADNLRTDTQRALGHIGFLLANAYAKNGDTANEHTVMQAMRVNLEKPVLDWLRAQLLHQRRSNN